MNDDDAVAASASTDPSQGRPSDGPGPIAAPGGMPAEVLPDPAALPEAGPASSPASEPASDATSDDGHVSVLQAFRALRVRPFALLWGGQTISRVGDFLFELALAWWVLQETGSATAVGTVMAFAFAPMLFFLLVGGVTVDRMHRVRIMLASDVVRGVVVSIVAALAYADRLELWHLYVLAVTFGIADAFFQPAYFALVPEVTPEEDLPSANALSSMSVQIGRVVGPAIAGAIVALGGASLAFAINGVSFFVAGALLLPLVGRFGQPKRMIEAGEARPSIAADLREGLATILGLPILWISIPLIALTNVLLAGPYSVALPALVQGEMGGDAQLLGLIYAVFPIGYILGGLWFGRKTRLRGRGPSAYVAIVVAGLGLAAFGLPLPLWALAAAALINGAALEIFGVIWMGIFQQMVPSEQMGRVSSLDQIGSFALLPIGFGLTGVVVDRLGAEAVFLLGGGLTAVLFLVGMGMRAVREFD